jgi:AAA+ ATPase superfamily predicted ATPase
LECLPRTASLYYSADERESALQRASLAAQLSRLIPNFDRVVYRDWGALFDRFWDDAPPGSILAIDEFPYLVAAAAEIPSILQKHVDQPRGIHLVLCGSSQRMMQGLVLDRASPLFGRAREILKIAPLEAGWIQHAIPRHQGDAVRAIESFAVWGGIPRYWELARDYASRSKAVAGLALDPLGVLFNEPQRLLLDDLRDVAQAASILSLIGQGCHRISEIAGRLEKPATSLSRPMQRLLELDLVSRRVPFGAPPGESKRSLYEIADPFTRFWFGFVEPNRSRLQAGQVSMVLREVESRFHEHVSLIWEDLVRGAIGRSRLFGRRWKPGQRWWGLGLNLRSLEIDLVAESTDGEALLIGEIEWASQTDVEQLSSELLQKVQRFPWVKGRRIYRALWLKHRPKRASVPVFEPEDVLGVLE